MPRARLSKKARRQEKILAALRLSASLRVSDLAESLDVSAETIRRDLDELNETGLLSRTYGGAAVRPLASEPSLNERYNVLVPERSRIGALAAQAIEPQQVVMIDAGSTTIHLAQHLANRASHLTVITNGIGVATALSVNPTIAVILCPGRYDPHEGSVSGPDANAFLQRFNADIAAIGASGLTIDGPNEVHPGSVWIKRSMIERARESVLVVDHTKFSAPMVEVICPLGRLSRIFTDQAPPPPLARAIASAGVELRLVAAETGRADVLSDEAVR